MSLVAVLYTSPKINKVGGTALPHQPFFFDLQENAKEPMDEAMHAWIISTQDVNYWLFRRGKSDIFQYCSTTEILGKGNQPHGWEIPVLPTL